jgi:hypothetical protein
MTFPKDVAVELNEARPEYQPVAGRQPIVAPAHNPALRVNVRSAVPRWNIRNESVEIIVGHFVTVPDVTNVRNGSKADITVCAALSVAPKDKRV